MYKTNIYQYYSPLMVIPSLYLFLLLNNTFPCELLSYTDISYSIVNSLSFSIPFLNQNSSTTLSPYIIPPSIFLSYSTSTNCHYTIFYSCCILYQLLCCFILLLYTLLLQKGRNILVVIVLTLIN